ncbi:MAG: ABC transporter permease [Lachnospiraceae bacterium]|nr:ABC transporter permease [Lachnospiraceae bacterium]
MFKAIKYVVTENISNLYRIFTISRYSIAADIHDSHLGLFWNFANPVIQVLTYWFLFGLVLKRKSVGDVPYLPWMLAGMAVWFFLSPCITNGCNAIFQKAGVISKMKFPVSILPATVVMQEFFNHLCFMIIAVIGLLIYGFYPSIYWFELLYYMIAAILFAISLALVTSVLNMIARDTRKFILAIMRLLLYLTPILWDIKTLPKSLQFVMKCNPIYYIVTGYRDCFFYHKGILFYEKQLMLFWGTTIVLFAVGSTIMYKFKTRFIDLL